MKRLTILVIFISLCSFVFALEINSEVLNNKDYLPDRYTCDSNNFSPPLQWSGVPAAARSLVIICDDPDAPFNSWVHWILFNISPDIIELKENITSQELKELGIVEGRNDFGRLGYGGPCPPAGKVHRYFFKIYALDTVLTLQEGVTKKEIEEKIQGHILAEAKLVGLYKKNEEDSD